MAHEFCMNCGHKIQYSLKKPNFCPQCGNGITEASEASTVNDVVEKEVNPGDQSGPWLQHGLQYEITRGDSGNITIGDLVKDAQQREEIEGPGVTHTRIDRPVPPVSEKDALKEAMSMCLSSRQSEDVGD